ncbi:hypothetical protein J6590_066529 [Homalodisca vitripennis]|nr:hypothetical protein J6590_066529 [Homalodisca vitripennis]
MDITRCADCSSPQMCITQLFISTAPTDAPRYNMKSSHIHGIVTQRQSLSFTSQQRRLMFPATAWHRHTASVAQFHISAAPTDVSRYSMASSHCHGIVTQRQSLSFTSQQRRLMLPATAWYRRTSSVAQFHISAAPTDVPRYSMASSHSVSRSVHISAAPTDASRYSMHGIVTQRQSLSFTSQQRRLMLPATAWHRHTVSVAQFTSQQRRLMLPLQHGIVAHRQSLSFTSQQQTDSATAWCRRTLLVVWFGAIQPVLQFAAVQHSDLWSHVFSVPRRMQLVSSFSVPPRLKRVTIELAVCCVDPSLKQRNSYWLLAVTVYRSRVQLVSSFSVPPRLKRVTIELAV